jgi:predicted anti-sigma-YlaC factor YlaD
MSHEASRFLVAGAALDDLGPGERDAYEAHLAGCGSCRALETDLEQVLADLALVAPQQVPPSDLLGAILAGLREDPDGQAPAAFLSPSD